MTKYGEILNDESWKDRAIPLSVDIKTWKESGDYLIGELIDIKPFSGGEFETSCMQYTFKNEDGLVSTILGSSMDKIFEREDYRGRVIHIEYKGKLELDDGKRCNKFQIMDVTDLFNRTSKLAVNKPDAS
jgi:hypothetical protein